MNEPSDTITHPTTAELLAGVDVVRQAPADDGVLEMIVRRPAIGQREILDTGELDVADGLVGDTWRMRKSNRTADGTPHPDMQLNVISARAVALVAGPKERWHLAGDQLIVDIDLSAANMPPGTRLEIGSAIIEVTDQPHTGCGKFVQRFGVDSAKFVNSPLGRELQLRGLNARVVQAGTIRVGDRVRKRQSQ